MRVTDSSRFITNWRNLQMQFSEQAHLQQQLSSGKRILTDSDDPVDAAEVQKLRRQLGYTKQYKENAARADTQLKFVDSALNGASNLLLQAIQIASQAAGSQILQPSDRMNLAAQVRALKSQLVSFGNVSLQGQFLLAGSQTSKKPFTMDSKSGQVTFNGNSAGRTVAISPTDEVQATISGQTVFLTKTNIFDDLEKLAVAIENEDLTTTASLLLEIEKGRAAVSETRGKIGTQIQLIDRVGQRLEGERESLLGRASDLEDADIAHAVSKLALVQTAIQASLFTVGSTARRTLFDFIA